jgi:hypothetical protein
VSLASFMGIGSFGDRDHVVATIAEAIGWSYGGMTGVPTNARGMLSVVVSASGAILSTTVESASLTPAQRIQLAAGIRDDIHDTQFAMCASAGDITIAVPFGVSR